MDVQLLDCTLRDGGYINDWEFGYDNIVSIFERLADSNVDIIELGFLDSRREYDNNRTIFPDTESLGLTYKKLDKKNSLTVAMIDFGTCPIENIEDSEKTVIDGIRVIFKKEKMIPALEFCQKVKNLGYKIFTQAVSITAYNDDELVELARRVNELDPYALSIVDTYGLLHQNNLMHILEVFDDRLSDSIRIGYHSHNNFQLGYSNCIEVINHDSKHDILVDGSLYGMGKSAGNAPIELIAMYLNNNLNKKYDINQMLEIIEVNLMDFYKMSPWGYNFFYYIAASNKCHPNYVSYLMNKNTLSIKSINEILLKLEGDKKLLYDAELIEELYCNYQKNEISDTDDMICLKEKLSSKTIMVLGPGKNLELQKQKVSDFINEKKPFVISINFIPEKTDIDMVFLSNSKRQKTLIGNLKRFDKNPEIVATSNVIKTEKTFDYNLNYGSLLDEEEEIKDNSLIMFLKVLIKLQINEVYLAGFDGYSSKEMNYFNTNMEYDFAKEKSGYLNNYTNKFLKKGLINVTFITDTKYLSEG